MLEHYTDESAAALLREVTGINEFPDNCSGLAACLNAAIAKIQANYYHVRTGKAVDAAPPGTSCQYPNSDRKLTNVIL